MSDDIVQVYKPDRSFFKIKAYEPLSFWLLLQGTYGLSIELTKKLSEGQTQFYIVPSNKNLLTYQTKRYFIK